MENIFRTVRAIIRIAGTNDHAMLHGEWGILHRRLAEKFPAYGVNGEYLPRNGRICGDWKVRVRDILDKYVDEDGCWVTCDTCLCPEKQDEATRYHGDGGNGACRTCRASSGILELHDGTWAHPDDCCRAFSVNGSSNATRRRMLTEDCEYCEGCDRSYYDGTCDCQSEHDTTGLSRGYPHWTRRCQTRGTWPTSSRRS